MSTIQSTTSADTGTSAAADVQPLGSALKIAVTLTADVTKLDNLTVTYESGPTSGGPWRIIGQDRVGPNVGLFGVGVPATSYRRLLQADKFLRASWLRNGTADGTFALTIVADDLVIPRRLIQAPNVDTNYGLADGNLLVAVAGGTPHLTAGRTYTILDAGTESGHEFDAHNLSAFTVILHRQDGTTVETLTSGQRVKLVWVDFGTPQWMTMGAY